MYTRKVRLAWYSPNTFFKKFIQRVGPLTKKRKTCLQKRLYNAVTKSEKVNTTSIRLELSSRLPFFPASSFLLTHSATTSTVSYKIPNRITAFIHYSSTWLNQGFRRNIGVICSVLIFCFCSLSRRIEGCQGKRKIAAKPCGI